MQRLKNSFLVYLVEKTVFRFNAELYESGLQLLSCRVNLEVSLQPLYQYSKSPFNLFVLDAKLCFKSAPLGSEEIFFQDKTHR